MSCSSESPARQSSATCPSCSIVVATVTLRVEGLAGERQERLADPSDRRRMGMDQRGDLGGDGLPGEGGIASAMRSVTCGPIMWTPRTGPAVLLGHDLHDARLRPACSPCRSPGS